MRETNALQYHNIGGYKINENLDLKVLTKKRERKGIGLKLKTQLFLSDFQRRRLYNFISILFFFYLCTRVYMYINL